uniref:Uncharacterized protein n=1 Tax=viral metagenome TaxID=1070528 RepID=A0A6C0CLS2_9ZZZZ
MHDTYKIEGAEHFVHSGQKAVMNDPNFEPDFQKRLQEFKDLVVRLVAENKPASFIHFGDGDWYFLKGQSVGSAKPGKRALSVSYDKIDIPRFREGFLKCDYYCVEYMEPQNRPRLYEIYPQLKEPGKTIPTEFLYGLVSSRWFFRQFKGKIGLIGAGEKLDLIKELMKRSEYRDYLGLDKFNDYIKIPQKFACDNVDNTIEMVKKQLLSADPETKVYLYGVGHVKSELIHHLPKIKNAIYLDVGGGIDGIAGILDPERPYAYGWTNYRLKNYDYGKIDHLAYNTGKDNKLKVLS